MYQNFQEFLTKELQEIKNAGLWKNEREITSPQNANISVKEDKVLNFCANNYLGLANNPRLIAAAKKAMDERGYGMASVRFICGTQDLHKALEKAIAKFFNMEDTILYAACFDANGGVFEPLLGEKDAIISDALNHASIIDGVRLCKAQRFRYANADMADLEAQLVAAKDCRFKLIVTDGVFSMDGNVAPLDKIYDLAQKHGAMVMVDESHSAGVVGKTGRGVTERYDLMGKIEIITGTLGKAFGGAIGGFTTGKKRDYRYAPSAFASVSLLELYTAYGSCRRYRSAEHHAELQRPARQATRQHRILRIKDESRRIRHQTAGIGYLCRDALRCETVAGYGCRYDERGHLRYGLLLSRGTERTGSYPSTDFGSSRARTPRQMYSRIHQDRKRARRIEIS